MSQQNLVICVNAINMLICNKKGLHIAATVNGRQLDYVVFRSEYAVGVALKDRLVGGVADLRKHNKVSLAAEIGRIIRQDRERLHRAGERVTRRVA